MFACAANSSGHQGFRQIVLANFRALCAPVRLHNGEASDYRDRSSARLHPKVEMRCMLTHRTCHCVFSGGNEHLSVTDELDLGRTRKQVPWEADGSRMPRRRWPRCQERPRPQTAARQSARRSASPQASGRREPPPRARPSTLNHCVCRTASRYSTVAPSMVHLRSPWRNAGMLATGQSRTGNALISSSVFARSRSSSAQALSNSVAVSGRQSLGDPKKLLEDGAELVALAGESRARRTWRRTARRTSTTTCAVAPGCAGGKARRESRLRAMPVPPRAPRRAFRASRERGRRLRRIRW